MERGQIIPPLSIIRLVRSGAQTPHWKNQIGRVFRVGYYSRRDGTQCVWLVNDAGEYEQTVDQNQLCSYFDVVERSRERSLFGRNKPPIPPLHGSRNGKHPKANAPSPIHV